MNFGPESKTEVSAANFSFGSKAKIGNISPNIFSTFYQYSSRLPCSIQHIKNLAHPFSVSARYGPFWLLTWSKMKHFDFFHKTKNDYLQKVNDLCFMKKVKIFHFWPYQKSKWTISFRNGKRVRQIFDMLYSTWPTTGILIKSWKNIGGNITYFCLGPKTEISSRDLSFRLRSKIHVFGSTIS